MKRSFASAHGDNVLQALLTGLTVMTPRDPWQFVSHSLRHIKDASVTNIPRYSL